MSQTFPPVRLAALDLDGTLLDSMPIWRDLGTSVLRGLGIEPEPETDEMLKTLSLRHGIAYCKEHYHLPQTEEELIGRVVDRVADFYQHEVQAKPGVDKFLSLLKMEACGCMWPLPRTALWRKQPSAMQGSTLLPGTYHCGGGGGRQKGERRDLRAGHAPPSVQQEGHGGV